MLHLGEVERTREGGRERAHKVRGGGKSERERERERGREREGWLARLRDAAYIYGGDGHERERRRSRKGKEERE